MTDLFVRDVMKNHLMATTRYVVCDKEGRCVPIEVPDDIMHNVDDIEKKVLKLAKDKHDKTWRRSMFREDGIVLTKSSTYSSINDAVMSTGASYSTNQSFDTDFYPMTIEVPTEENNVSDRLGDLDLVNKYKTNKTYKGGKYNKKEK